jgi:hypothetical protein
MREGAAPKKTGIICFENGKIGWRNVEILEGAAPPKKG